jgi:hypothetical protein
MFRRAVLWPMVVVFVATAIGLAVVVGLVFDNAYIVALVLFVEGLLIHWAWGREARRIDRRLKAQGHDDGVSGMTQDQVLAEVGLAGTGVRLVLLLTMFLLFPLSAVMLVVAVVIH